jgi:hypothetical protein
MSACGTKRRIHNLIGDGRFRGKDMAQENGVMSAYDAVVHTPGQKGNRDCAQLWLDTVKLSTVNRWGTWGDSGTSRRVGNTVGLGNGFLERHWLSCNDARSMRHTLFCSSCELLRRITARSVFCSFPPPTLGERRHRCLARRFVAVRRRAVFVVSEY